MRYTIYMPQSEMLHLHEVLSELDSPELRKRLIEIIVEELEKDSKMRRTVEKLVRETKGKA